MEAGVIPDEVAGTREAHAHPPRLAYRLVTRALVCLALVAAADWLFFERTLGWSLCLYTVMALLGISMCQPLALMQRRSAQVLFGLIAGLGLASVVHPTPQGFLLAVAGLVAYAIVGRQGWVRGVGTWIFRYVAFGMFALFQPFKDVGVASRWSGRHGSKRTPWRLLLWALPVVLGLVFLALFAAANPIIERGLDETTRSLRGFLGGLDAARALFWSVVGWGAWALLRTRAPRFLGGPAFDRQPALLSAAMLVRCLLVFNLVFLLQNVLDLRYLWLGAALPDGMTYAAYAHRGAYALVATALLAAGFVLVTFRTGDATPGPWARRLVYLWLVQNVVLSVAAATRLALYVEAYRLTRLRLAAAIWIGLVALGLVLIAVRILTRRSNRWLVRANTISALAVLYVCCFLDLPGFIANYNVAHCREISGRGQPVDLQYLDALGPSALPAWSHLASATNDAELEIAARARVSSIRRRLTESTADWRGWTLRRARLLDLPVE